MGDVFVWVLILASVAFAGVVVWALVSTLRALRAQITPEGKQ